VQIDVRWPAGDPVRVRKDTAELVALAPDVIFSAGSSVLATLLQQTPTVPIVFVQVLDPVAGGFVSSLAKPGGNATGFVTFEYMIVGKWITLLRDIAPSVNRITVVQDPLLGVSAGLVGAAQAVSFVLGMQLTAATVRAATDIERSIDAAAREQGSGLLVIPGPATTTHLERIIALAARHRLPAIYPFRYMASAGGLISYGPELMEQDRQAASYVDRILRGERPGELPVQTPTKYQLVINLATAKALGLDVPPTLLTQADEVIE
jgi:putative ABC transport system substrate-binding protein